MSDLDYDSDRDYGDSDYGSQRKSSSSSNKQNKLDPSKLVNTMIDEEGRFLGMKLSPEMAKQLREFLPMGLLFLSDKGHDFVLHAKWGGEKEAKVAGYALALTEQIIQTLQNVVELTTSLGKVNATMKPLAKAANKNDHSIVPLTMNNEVIASARSKIMSIFSQRMIETLVSTIGAGMAIINVASKKSSAIKDSQAIMEMEESAKTGDVNKLADELENQIHGGSKTGAQKGWTGEQIRQAEAIAIKRRQNEWEKGLEQFIAKDSKQFTETKAILDKELNALNRENYRTQLDKLDNLGIETRRLREDIKAAQDMTVAQRKKIADGGNHYAKRKALDPADELKEIIAEYVTESKNKGALESSVTHALKKQYVQDKGAFNETVRRQYGDRNQPTIEEEMRKEFKDVKAKRDEFLKAQKNAGEKDSGYFKKGMEYVFSFASGLFREVAQNIVGGKALDQLKKPIASDRIVHLIKTMDSGGRTDWTPPKQVPPISDRESGKRGRDSDDGITQSLSYSRYIHEIFEQNQKDYKRPEVGDRYLQELEKAHWDDSEIQKIPDDQLNPYEFAIKHITKRIIDGRMSPAALVYLVGDPNGKKIVHSDGQTFGPKGAGKDDASIKAAILKIIDENTALLHTDQDITSEQFSEKMGKLSFPIEEMKKILESKELDKDQRAFIFTLLSDVVGSDDRICKTLGIKNERCQELRKESKENMNITLDAITHVLAGIIENNPKSIKNLTLMDKDRNTILSLSERAHEGGEHVADVTKDREELETLKTIALNALMALNKEPAIAGDDGKPQNFWQRVKDEIEELKKPKEAKQEEMSEQESDKDERRDHHRKGRTDDMSGYDSDKENHRDHRRKSRSDETSPWEEEEVASKKKHGSPEFDIPEEELFSEREHNAGKRSNGNGVGKKWAVEKSDDDFTGRERRKKTEKLSSIRGELS